MKKLLLLLLCVPLIGLGQEYYCSDTLIINGNIYPLISISKKEFANCKHQSKKEEVDLLETIGEIEIEGNDEESVVYILNLENGSKDTISGYDDAYGGKTTISSLVHFSYWLISENTGEERYEYFKNKYDGEIINGVAYNPVYSPEHNFYISYTSSFSFQNSFQSSQHEGIIDNGLALYEIRNKRIIEIFSIECTWAPEDVCWKDNNTIYIEQICVDYDKEKYTQRFKKLIIE
ncbi:hypothetical protein OAJ56_02120 [Flavobacteriales bacterium]|nr:hypothetical protein [Flavobacteriales bacterium]